METAKAVKAKNWVLQMEALFKACADQTRLRILNLLICEGEVCVCHLVEVLQTNQPKVSRHLAYLKRVGLVADRKDGLRVYYRLAMPLAEHVQRLIHYLNGCCVEVPEMQQDVLRLQSVRGTQAVVKLSRRSFPAIRASQVISMKEAQTEDRAPEIKIELL